MKFLSEMSVRYSETDQMGVVYHANYLSWFDVARTHLLREAGFPYELCEERGYFAPVVHAEIDYGIPFRFGESAIIVTYIKDVTPVKTTYCYELYGLEDDREVAKPRLTGHTIHCLVDKNNFKPVSLKKVLPDLYEIYQQIKED